MERHLLILTAIMCLASVRSEAEDSGYKSYTIKNTETLYQACKAAVEEYKEKPQEIGNSTCGAYIQGFVGGYKVGALFVYAELPSKWKEDFYEEELKSNDCVTSSISLQQAITSFIAYREKHPEFNDSAFGGLWGSFRESEKCVLKKKEQQ